MTYRLPASAQPQLWIRDYATDAGSPIAFDAHEAMIGLPARRFNAIAAEILKGYHDIDELVIDSGVMTAWLNGSKDSTFRCDVDAEDFESWLDGLGLSREDSVAMTEQTMTELRDRASAPAVPSI